MRHLGRRDPYAELGQVKGVAQFATPFDHKECRRIHRQFGSTYFLATERLPRRLRRRIHALYGFVRLPDEWIDNYGGATPVEREKKLNAYRNEFLRGMDGVRPEEPVLRAFCDVAREAELPLEDPLLFLDAMEEDIYTSRYESYEQLQIYMRGSAVAVGLMMCDLLEVKRDTTICTSATALGEAMQLTNFLRDVGEDLKRGRLYIPMEDVRRFPGAEDAIACQEVNPPFIELLQFETSRALNLYKKADEGIPLLPSAVQKPVKLARTLYARILDKIEDRRYDVFHGRARTSRFEKLATAIRIMGGLS